MTKDQLKIVFFGSPDFAVESLRRLVAGGYGVVGVVTATDKPAGRGHHLLQSDVKRYALEQSLHVMQPAHLKDETFLSELRALQADLFIVIAFRMLPAVVWQMPRLGTFNLHASLLPKYRGAAPINWAVINGETQTGVTTFFLQHEIDTGDIIQQRAIDIGRTDDVGIVHDRLMRLGADMVVETVESILAGTVQRIPQELLLATGHEATAAPKIYKDTCRIDWHWSAERVYNHTRGLSPYPTAWTELSDDSGQVWTVKVFATGEPLPLPWQMSPGECVVTDKTLAIAASDGLLEVKSLQPAGKKRMDIDEFLRGLRYQGQLCCR